MALRRNSITGFVLVGAVALTSACTTKDEDAQAPATNPPVAEAQNGEDTLVIDAASQPARKNGGYRYGYPFKIGNPYKIDGVTYTPKEQPEYEETGIASWYGPTFHGKYTANGEKYDMNQLTAAHRTLPMPSWVEVTNLTNKKKIVVRINDRGPFAKNRIIDLSRAAADQLGVIGPGTAKVQVRLVEPPRKLQQAGVTKPNANPASGAVQERLMESQQFFVQIGAFGDRNNARLTADSASHISSVQLVEAKANGRTLYRVWLGPMKDQQHAAQTLALARAEGYSSAHITSSRNY